jgi:hypothetical protein
MEEILEKLLSSELLSEETRTEISEAWSEAVEAKKQELREEVALEVRAELAEQFVAAREALVEKVEAFVAEQLESEISELKGDIERFRDLEAEYAGKLVEEKQRLAEEVEQEIDSLVDKLDIFLEVRLAEEIEEMREDLEIVKQNDFGRRVFESFVTEYAKSYVDEKSIQSKLTVTESKLEDAMKLLKESETEKSKLVREQKMTEVLKPLSGSKREQMSFVLQNVETEKLEEAYTYFIGRVLREETAPKPSIKEVKDPIVSESKKEETILATGDVITEEVDSETLTKAAAELSFLKRIAGISS